MPYNPLMVNNKKINIPKEKPKNPSQSIQERLLCWSRLLMASLLAGGKFLVLNLNHYYFSLQACARCSSCA